jgi:hypothetical protein
MGARGVLGTLTAVAGALTDALESLPPPPQAVSNATSNPAIAVPPNRIGVMAHPSRRVLNITTPASGAAQRHCRKSSITNLRAMTGFAIIYQATLIKPDNKTKNVDIPPLYIPVQPSDNYNSSRPLRGSVIYNFKHFTQDSTMSTTHWILLF